MISLSVSYSQQGLKNSLDAFVTKLAADVEATAVSYTPIKTGNARRGWSKTIKKGNFEVKNQVPYIGKLEAGASRQAPKGILGPTLTTIKGKYK